MPCCSSDPLVWYVEHEAVRFVTVNHEPSRKNSGFYKLQTYPANANLTGEISIRAHCCRVPKNLKMEAFLPSTITQLFYSRRVSDKMTTESGVSLVSRRMRGATLSR
ncbi:hypothetical protein CC1G_15690 [Coprinopsis cinerea okayama7|uniref:Uncharacterized protein n=1 Tax=Coprinopsis cinerea (strain Okayama-7 / 130 / ATCC MYA-4618 / FGSC 9003) TaxID=240176 RepID=D6RQF1_COPC7|nr:hypothetical protein CC1G_15690 [Coprinopsis cinerea okayama7\|eukprot:XP_002910261.1 hypothetical protein CC1G_15690 [Coprinopsis cinerea okayama7\